MRRWVVTFRFLGEGRSLGWCVGSATYRYRWLAHIYAWVMRVTLPTSNASETRVVPVEE